MTRAGGPADVAVADDQPSSRLAAARERSRISGPRQHGPICGIARIRRLLPPAESDALREWINDKAANTEDIVRELRAMGFDGERGEYEHINVTVATVRRHRKRLFELPDGCLCRD